LGSNFTLATSSTDTIWFRFRRITSTNGGFSADTVSATTYYNLPIDIRVTGGTYNQSNGIATYTNNTGGTFTVSGFTLPSTYTFTGGTVSGATLFTGGLTANTISASTIVLSGGNVQTQIDSRLLNPNYYIRTRWQGIRQSGAFSTDGFASGAFVYSNSNQVSSVGATNGFGVLPALNFASTSVSGTVAYYRQSLDATLLATKFMFEGHIGTVTNVTDGRLFYGLQTATGANPTNVEPNTIVNCIAVCKLSTSNNLHIVHNDASGTGTTIDLGSNFTLATSSTDTIWFRFRRITSTNVEYLVVKLNSDGDTLFTATGNITTDLPSSSTLLYHRFWLTNNTTASDFYCKLFNGSMGRY